MEPDDSLMSGLEPIGGTRISTAHGIAAIALSLAMKYHDTNTIKDGQLYQQYKLEGRNIRELQIDMVFETAMRIEMHLLASSERIACIVVEAIKDGVARDEAEETGK